MSDSDIALQRAKQINHLRGKLADAETEKIELGTAVLKLRMATVALVDVMPYLDVDPRSPHAEEWTEWKDAALDEAAKALDYVEVLIGRD